MKYTHRDGSGMGWRFDGSRPVSALADSIMADILSEEKAAKALAKRRSKKRRKSA